MTSIPFTGFTQATIRLIAFIYQDQLADTDGGRPKERKLGRTINLRKAVDSYVP